LGRSAAHEPGAADRVLKAACERADMATMATLDPYPETEHHPVHPGMTASQFKATCRDLQRKYPDLSDQEIEQRIVAILKPPAIESDPDRSALIRNAIDTELGGGEWPKVVSPVDPDSGHRIEQKNKLAQLAPVSGALRADLVIPDDLSIPDFLRRIPPQADDLPLAA
jgi:hypothetical protein